MKHGVFAIRDVCVNAYMVPMCFLNRAAAVRALGDAVNRKSEDNFHVHPEHFQLNEIASFDDESGLMESFVAPEFVVDCQSLVDLS